MASAKENDLTKLTGKELAAEQRRANNRVLKKVADHAQVEKADLDRMEAADKEVLDRLVNQETTIADLRRQLATATEECARIRSDLDRELDYQGSKPLLER